MSDRHWPRPVLAGLDVWSVVYRGAGFVGGVTMVGPDASEQGVKALARSAHAHAAPALSRS